MNSSVILRVGEREFPAALVILDLDGTLVDSVPDIAAAVDAVAIACDLEPPGEDRVRHWVGNGSRKLIERMLTACQGRAPSPTELEDACGLFLAAYETRLVQESCLYPGVREWLDGLGEAGVPLACVTNKPEKLARGVLEGLGLDGDCRWLVGGDTLATRKPDAGPVNHVMAQAGVGPAQTLLVGDSETDVATARAAGCSVVVFRYGYNQGFEGADVQPDAFVESLPEIGIAESA